MADSGNGGGGWPGFLGQLNQTFMLVRDLFGYALPGAVFLTIGLIYGGLSLSEIKGLLSPYTLPSWAAFIVVVAACYIAGDLMAAIAYMPISVAKYIVWMIDRHHLWLGEDEAVEGSLRDWLVNNPTEVMSKTLEIRAQHRELLETLDRRETLNVMAGSTAAALLVGWYVFWFAHWHFSRILLCGGLVLVIQFLTGLAHLRRVLAATQHASVSAPKAGANQAKPMSDLIAAATAALNKFAG